MKKFLYLIFIITISSILITSNTYATEIQPKEHIKITIFTDKHTNKKSISFNQGNTTYNSLEISTVEIYNDEIIEEFLIDDIQIKVTLKTNIDSGSKDVTVLMNKNIFQSTSKKVITNDDNFLREDFNCTIIDKVIQNNKIKNILYVTLNILILLFALSFFLVYLYRRWYMKKLIIIWIIIL